MKILDINNNKKITNKSTIRNKKYWNIKHREKTIN